MSCISPCIFCSRTPTNCTSCNQSSLTPFLIGNTCTSTCPLFYFSNSTSGICQSCSSVINLNCSNCINATNCNSCDPGYVLITTTMICTSSVPAGYVNISGVAVACQGNCNTCSGTIYNCTSCLTGNLQSNLCV